LVGLSRSTLLYYEKCKLISGKRLANGYRVYTEKDVQQVRLIQQLKNGGLTISECKACLESKLDKAVLLARYEALKQEFEKKQAALTLLEGLLGKATNKGWHETLSEIAPDAYLDWLMVQGYDEKQALRVKWLSKDMNEHESYMQDFLTIFAPLASWGPGSKADTTKAFQHLNFAPQRILEIGCGNGNATLTLAALSNADIVATDNEQSALDRLQENLGKHNLTNRVSTQCISMTELKVNDKPFDLIWAEASMYIMGVEKALAAWKPLLQDKGTLVFSDLVWFSESSDTTIKDFWRSEYPDMQSVQTRLDQIDKAGYATTASFEVSEQAWKDYYEPLQDRLNEVADEMQNSQAFRDIQREVNLYKDYLGEFGYQFFIVQKQ